MENSEQAAPSSTKVNGTSAGRRVAFFVGFIIIIVGIISLTLFLIYRSVVLPRHDAKGVAAGVVVNTFLTFPQDKTFPTGLALAPDGTMYLSLFGLGTIEKVDAQGNMTAFIDDKTKITAPGAILFNQKNELFVLDYPDTYKSTGDLKKITPDGKVTSFGDFGGDEIVIGAAMAFDGDGNLYVTSPGSGQIWRFAPDGTGSVWWTLSPVDNVSGQPTGIAYDAAHQAMIIGDTATGSIYQVSIISGKNAGNVVLRYRQPDLKIQGLTLDDQGRVLIANWAYDNGQLQRLESSGVLNLLAEGFRAPATLQFRDKKLYVTNSDLTGLVAPDLFGILPSPLRAKPPFTVDVVDLGG